MPPTRKKTLDDPHTIEEFARWLGVGVDWVQRRIKTLPGVIIESRKVVRIVPRSYLEARLKGKRS